MRLARSCVRTRLISEYDPRVSSGGDDSKPTVGAKGQVSEPPATERDAPTDEGAGRYRDREEIARGGMGRVVEAMDTLLGRRVALKEALSTDTDALRRFAREIRITARLEHPSIVPVYDAGEAADGSPYYVMRKVSGQPLEELVAAAETLPQRLALLPHLVAAANAVAHAHGRGIVHRDLKPSNILVGDLGETVVIDWGLAKVIDEPDDEPTATTHAFDAGDSLRTRIGTVFGTPGFMSPEQLRGEPVDERSDVYALGATLYHLLARRPPHARSSGTEMMGAAAQGPPQPIRELVPGVPPELSTIVDKALAYDDRVRYPNAGALAEDLQRFLTGQLVASHHYSTRERVARFLRKYRVAVGAISLAIVATAIAGAISISRVLEARDRTDAALKVALVEKRTAEAAEERATARANELTLAQARALVDTNPTAAVALVKPLASSPLYWRQVRDVGAAARSAGAAWGLPGPVTVRALEQSPTGNLAVLTDGAGIVRLYDLVARTSRQLPAGGKGAVATFADDGHIVVSAGPSVTTIDLATGAAVRLVADGNIAQLVATSHAVLWRDDEGSVWRTTIALAPPRKLALPFRADRLSHSPDERFLGIQTIEHFYVVDLASEAITVVGDAPASDVAWDPAGKSVAAMVGTTAYDILLDPRPHVTRAVKVAVPLGLARFAEKMFYITNSPLGVSFVGDGGPVFRYPFERISSGLKVARDDIVISDSAAGGLLVLSGERDLILHSPSERLLATATSPHGHFLVAASEKRLLIWDLDVLLPRRIVVGDMAGFTTVGTDQVIVRRILAPWNWVNLRTGTSTDLPIDDPIARVIPGPGGDRAIVLFADRTVVITRTGDAPIQIDEPAVLGLPITNDRAFFATAKGEVVLFDPRASPPRRLLTSHASEPVFVAWDKAWFAVQFEDGLIWRHNELTGVDGTLSLAAHPGDGTRLHLAGDGRVFAADGDEVLSWYPDGRLLHHARLPFDVLQIFGVDDDVALAITADHAAYLIDFAQPDRIVSTMASGAQLVWVSGTNQLALIPGAKIGFDIVDLMTGSRWPLGGGPAMGAAQITVDGSRVVEMLAQDTLGIWPLQLPGTREAVAPWIESISNATTEHGTASVSWRD